MAELLDYLSTAPVVRTFVQYLIVFCSWLEAAIDVISGRFAGLTVADNRVKLFRDHRLNRSGEIQPKAIGCSIFGHFSNFCNRRPEVAGDVISSAASAYVTMDVPTKFGDSRLNIGWIIGLFVQPNQFYVLLCSI